MNCTKRCLLLGSIALAISLTLLPGIGQAELMFVPSGQFDSLADNYINSGDVGGGWMRSGGSTFAYAGIGDINAAAYPSGLGTASGKKIWIQFQTRSSNSNVQGYVTSPTVRTADNSANLLIGPNSTYTITVAVGNKTGNEFPGSLSGQNRNALELLFDGSLKAVKAVTVGGTQATSLPPTGTDGTWADTSITFKTDSLGVVTECDSSAGLSWENVPTLVGQNLSGQTLKIKLRADTYNKAGAQVIEFDNVRVDVVTVPEPGTLAMLCAGVLGLLGVMRRRSRRA